MKYFIPDFDVILEAKYLEEAVDAVLFARSFLSKTPIKRAYEIGDRVWIDWIRVDPDGVDCVVRVHESDFEERTKIRMYAVNEEEISHLKKYGIQESEKSAGEMLDDANYAPDEDCEDDGWPEY